MERATGELVILPNQPYGFGLPQGRLPKKKKEKKKKVKLNRLPLRHLVQLLRLIDETTGFA